LIVFVFLLQSCVKNDISLSNVDGTIGINGALVFPIATSTITISQFLNHQNITTLSQETNGTMFLFYNPGTYFIDLISSVTSAPITILGSHTVDLSFMHDVIQSSSALPFANPQLRLTISNSASSPLTLKIDSISSYNSSQSSNMVTTKSFSVDTLRVESNATGSLNFDKNNGHIDSLFSLPGINKMIFYYSVLFPKGIQSSDVVTVSPYVKLPLSFNPGADIIMSDTIVINNPSFHDFLNKTNVKEMALWLIASNNTSAQIGVTASLLNSNQQTIGTPQDVTLKVSANVDATGRPVLPSETTTDQYFKLYFNYSDIQQANYITLKYTLQGKDVQTPLTVNATDFVKAKVSAYAKGISFQN
jgi:hypothetical protein